jgi:hypothetical protein
MPADAPFAFREPRRILRDDHDSHQAHPVPKSPARTRTLRKEPPLASTLTFIPN